MFDTERHGTNHHSDPTRECDDPAVREWHRPADEQPRLDKHDGGEATDDTPEHG